MASLSTAFTSATTGGFIIVQNGQSYTYTVTGTFVGTWIVETTKDQTNFTQIATGTGTQAAVTIDVKESDSSPVFVRTQCSALLTVA